MTEVGSEKATGAIRARMERNFMAAVAVGSESEGGRPVSWSERLSWLDWLAHLTQGVVFSYVVDHCGRLR